MRKQVISATVSQEAFELKAKLKKKGINYSPFAEKLIFDLAKKHKLIS